MLSKSLLPGRNLSCYRPGNQHSKDILLIHFEVMQNAIMHVIQFNRLETAKTPPTLYLQTITFRS